MEPSKGADKCPVQHAQTSTCPVTGNTPAAETSGCPVQQSRSTWLSLSNWFQGTTTPPPASPTPEPVASTNSAVNPLTNEFDYSQSRHPDQQTTLGVHRQQSSIPKGEFTPKHQPENEEYWVYPSEQQYFNAMKRKGYSPPENDMSVILTIHNLVNEQGWSKIKEWERQKGCEDPKLVRFMGRPTDISPKARLRSLIGYTLPFDRHDWIIDRNGQQVRYVIDFYKGATRVIETPQGRQEAPVSIYLDVRPALDSVEALVDRMSMSTKELFPSLASRAPEQRK